MCFLDMLVLLANNAKIAVKLHRRSEYGGCNVHYIWHVLGRNGMRTGFVVGES